jgi:hypothetical protein
MGTYIPNGVCQALPAEKTSQASLPTGSTAESYKIQTCAFTWLLTGNGGVCCVVIVQSTRMVHLLGKSGQEWCAIQAEGVPRPVLHAAHSPSEV